MLRASVIFLNLFMQSWPELGLNENLKMGLLKGGIKAVLEGLGACIVGF